jgi:hypothetical protein
MPAAVAVPAIISAAGTAASAIGGHLARKGATSQAQQNYLDTQRQIDKNMAAQTAWQNQMRNDPQFASLMAQAAGPQQSSTSSSSSSTAWQDYGPQQGTLDEVMQAAKNSVGTANVLQNQQLAALNRNISAQGQEQDRLIRNIAASRGVDSNVAKLGMNQGINRQRLDAELGIAQQGRENTRQAWGDVNAILDRYKREHSKSRGSSTTTGGPNFGAYLNMQDLLRPQDRPVVQRQAV